jgi:post-segregation antitoxin (ccd killing protein)
MKNITISVDDELYRLARIKAAEQSTSISALFKAYIEAAIRYRASQAETGAPQADAPSAA